VVGIFLNRRNLIVLLMAIELMLLAVNLNFVAFSHYLGDMAGQVFVFFILTVAAAESAIGLAILVVLFRNRASINVEELDELKGEAETMDCKHGFAEPAARRAAGAAGRRHRRRPGRQGRRPQGRAHGHHPRRADRLHLLGDGADRRCWTARASTAPSTNGWCSAA
jgi:NADH-quinone oxidoreductase subunit K